MGGFFLLFFCLSLILTSSELVANADSLGASSPPANELYKDPTNGLGSWIWAAKVADNQTVLLWRSFEIPKPLPTDRLSPVPVLSARLKMTVDNEFTVFLDGRELGHGADYPELFIFDLTPLLRPGRHVLAVKAFNSYSFAGMILGLQIELAGGRRIEIKSDQNWRVVPDGIKGWDKMTEAAADWPAATVEEPLGGGPWWTTPQNICIMPTLQPVKVFFWQRGWFQITLLSICGIAILISFRLLAQLALNRKERLLLQEERARIARDIHDDIGARMTQLVLHGEVAQNDLSIDSEMRQQLNWICDEARGLLSTMDEILWAVNPRRDTLRDFASYVCKYAEEFLKPTQVQCFFEVEPEMSAANFDLPFRRSLLMAIKETLNNAVKYSQATELFLKIERQGDWLIVAVRDNGKGFDPGAVKPGRNGLTNMAQRMSELGGNCLVASQPGTGCQVEFRVPIAGLRRHPLSWIWSAKQFAEQNNWKKRIHPSEPSQNHDPTKC